MGIQDSSIPWSPPFCGLIFHPWIVREFGTIFVPLCIRTWKKDF